MYPFDLCQFPNHYHLLAFYKSKSFLSDRKPIPITPNTAATEKGKVVNYLKGGKKPKYYLVILIICTEL